jgi:hypothetical protein
MKPRNIIIILIIGLILFLCLKNSGSNSQSEQSQSLYPPKSPSLNPNINPITSSHYFNSKDDPKFDREEIFERSVKGYREYTYWGSEHPIQEQTRHFDDDEFDTFIKEEIKDNDAKIFWGAEY